MGLLILGFYYWGSVYLFKQLHMCLYLWCVCLFKYICNNDTFVWEKCDRTNNLGFVLSLYQFWDSQSLHHTPLSLRQQSAWREGGIFHSWCSNATSFWVTLLYMLSACFRLRPAGDCACLLLMYCFDKSLMNHSVSVLKPISDCSTLQCREFL